MLEQEGAIPKLFPQSWSMELTNISWYAEAFRVPFTGTEGPRPAAEKHVAYHFVAELQSFPIGSTDKH